VLNLDRPGAAIIFALTIGASFIGLFWAPQLVERSLFRPHWFFRRRQYDTIYMSSFVHADLGHLLLNMITFYFFAFALEAQIGTVKFLALYFVGILVSHGYTYLRHENEPEYASLGASGAIAAVLLAYVVYFPTATLMMLPLPVPIPAPLFAAGYIAYSFWAGRRRTGRINHDAHLAGALAGLAFVAVTEPAALSRLIEMIGLIA
jgi:membrane associated rhomboid family serine protease